jgi:protein TonB
MRQALTFITARHWPWLLSAMLHIVLLTGPGPAAELSIDDSGTPALPLALHFSLLTDQSASPQKKQSTARNPVADYAPVEQEPGALSLQQKTRQPERDNEPDTEMATESLHAMANQQAAVTHQSDKAGLQPVPVSKTVGYRYPPTPPVYPRLALRRGQQGEAVIQARVNPQGETERIKLVHSSGYQLLDESAINAVSGWAFAAAKRNGVAITAWIEVPVKFEIK